jgi:hypothetical protein
MMDLGLLEVFLPEAYAMVTAGERGLGEFGAILPGLDRLVEEGKTPSEGLRLSALLLPTVLLRHHDVEALNQKPLKVGGLKLLVAEAIAPFVQRFALSRAKTEQVQKTLFALLRMQRPGLKARERVHLASQPAFSEALLLLEILQAAVGGKREELEIWRRVKRECRREPRGSAEKEPRRSPPKRRKRRRRRRRKKSHDTA